MSREQVVVIRVNGEIVETLSRRSRQIELRQLFQRGSTRSSGNSQRSGQCDQAGHQNFVFACLSSGDLVRSRRPLMRHRIRGSALAELVESRFETGGELFRWASTPVMQEDHHGPSFDHVIMDCDHIDAVLAKSLQNRSDFVFEHSYIASDSGVLVGTYKGGPGVET